MMQVLLFSAVAGIVGTGLGGVTSAILLRHAKDHVVCWMLSFAAGIMTGIVCFSLVPESVEITNTIITIVGLILGVIVIKLLNRIVDKVTGTSAEGMKVHCTHAELYHEHPLIQNRSNMLYSGIIMFAAISLHNLPEGVAIGAGGAHDAQFGALLAFIIMLHNLPEGMAIAAPMLVGGLNKWKVIFLTSLSGAPTLLGGFIGVLIGNISDTAVALSLSVAGGAMLYVVFGEIIPQSIVLMRGRTATIVTLIGVIVGLALTMV